jgi:hypothetical protein
VHFKAHEDAASEADEVMGDAAVVEFPYEGGPYLLRQQTTTAHS